MTISIKTFENSLRDYLVSVESDAYNTQSKMNYRYNNLKVFMDITRVQVPHFFVSMAISSACYSLDPLEKIEGSMGEDEIYIMRWASRPNILGELKKYWKYYSKSNADISEIAVKTEMGDNQSIAVMQDTDVQEVGDAITGSGVKKSDESPKFKKIENKKTEGDK